MNERLAIDIGGTKLALAAITESGQISSRQTTITPRRDDELLLTGGELAEWAAKRARVFWNGFSGGESEPALVGVSSPGVIDDQAENAFWASLPRGERLVRWREAVLGEFTESEFRLMNDGDAFAWGEWVYGVSTALGVSTGVGRVIDWGSGEPKEVPNATDLLEPPSSESEIERMLAVCVGTGIGAGLVSAGRISSAPCEFGSVRAHSLGADFPASSFRGEEPDALESELTPRVSLGRAASGEAISARYEELSGEKIPEGALAGTRWVAHRASQGDELAASVLAAAGERIGAGLADLAVSLAPDRIVIGGGVGPVLFPVILARMRRELRKQYSHTRVSQSTLGADSHLLGAVAPLSR